jgi:hypothetical protein
VRVPVEDVRRRLFGRKVVQGDVTSTATILPDEGVEAVSITDPDRKTMLRPPGAFEPDDAGAILGVFSSGYAGHDYETWLLDTVAQILDDSLSIGSAGTRCGHAGHVARSTRRKRPYASALAAVVQPRHSRVIVGMLAITPQGATREPRGRAQPTGRCAFQRLSV